MKIQIRLSDMPDGKEYVYNRVLSPYLINKARDKGTYFDIEMKHMIKEIYKIFLQNFSKPC